MFSSYWSVKDGLFIGDHEAALDPSFFMENKVTRVVNCCSSLIEDEWGYMGIEYLSYDWMDDDTQIILDSCDNTVNEVFDFLEGAEERAEGVLVQSFLGQSRACCILTAYLMKKYRWSHIKALEYLYFRCPVIHPNEGFMRQLAAYEERLSDEIGAPLSKTWEESEAEDVETVKDEDEGDKDVLQNTFANCLQPPVSELSDFQVKKASGTPKTSKIGFAEDLTQIRPYDVGSALEHSDANPQDDENHKVPALPKSILKSANKSSAKKTRTAKDTDPVDRPIVIERNSGSVRCTADEIVPYRFGIQAETKTILLEYKVPRLNLRAHHAMKVDLDGDLATRFLAVAGDTEPADRALVAELKSRHAAWLSTVSTGQLVKLVGQLRALSQPPDEAAAAEVKAKAKARAANRAPGRSPR
eukprot:TRINITY_DN26537_c0_g1_i1.p1 TRINITY_DN26537_c0_g1~~TRINITY_DN26537_c0_g1_i1.p1  ORF type:complete len:414 (+),score=63.16 TRINITY_DN26537_c0_g1_i1:75-1316(+)